MTGEWCLRGGMLKYEERGQEEPGLHLVSHIKESKVHPRAKTKPKTNRQKTLTAVLSSGIWVIMKMVISTLFSMVTASLM